MVSTATNHLLDTRSSLHTSEQMAPRVARGKGAVRRAEKVTPTVTAVTDVAVMGKAAASATPTPTQGKIQDSKPEVVCTAPVGPLELQERGTVQVRSQQGVETRTVRVTAIGIRDARRDARRPAQDADHRALGMGMGTGMVTGMAMEMGMDTGTGTDMGMGMDTVATTARAPVRVVPARVTAAAIRRARASMHRGTLAST
ncbi:MAG: hypothetical protein FD144_5880 [Rhodospirillaceae bacterium]|nr:MAG: hypothetical protein FD144_5880 [Rhodospirillaceae bacterium]